MITLLAVMIVVDYIIIKHQHSAMIDKLINHTRNEINFLSEAIKEPIKQRENAMIEHFINKWGEVHQYVTKFELIASNNVPLVAFRRKTENDSNLFSIQHRINVKTSEQYLLKLQIDLASINNELLKLITELIVSSILVTLFLGILLWFIFKKLAINPLTGKITTYRRTQRLLQKAKERFRTVADFTYDWEYWLSPEGKINYMSPSVKRITGYSIDEFMKDPTLLDSIIDPEYLSTFSNHCRNELIKSAPAKIEFRITTKSGKKRWLGHNCQMVYGPKKEFFGRRISNRDITDAKKAESKIRKSMVVAERATLAKTRFLSFISHELRTPLNAILGFSQLLSQSSTSLEKMQQEYVDYILQSGNILLKLINDFTDLSKIEAGKISLMFENINLSDSIKECLDLTNNLIQKKSIKIINKIGPNPPIIKADPIRCKQVFCNLISNAIKYNEDGGSVTITAGPTNHDRLRINIIDTGIGIKPEDHNKIFEPFERLKQEKFHVEGTGIGLTITKQLVELMKGKIGFYSTPKEGSIFWVEFPICTEVENEVYYSNENINNENNDNKINSNNKIYSDNKIKKYKSTLKKPLNYNHNRKIKILYIEDHPINLNLIQSTLSPYYNSNIIVANSAESGIPIAIEQQPDLILLDINLPGIDGYRTLKIIKNHQKTSQIPIIALSGLATANDIQKGLNAGFDHYLTKPLVIKQFLKVVRSY